MGGKREGKKLRKLVLGTALAGGVALSGCTTGENRCAQGKCAYAPKDSAGNGEGPKGAEAKCGAGKCGGTTEK